MVFEINIFTISIVLTDPVSQRCSVKNVFLKNSHSSQENASARFFCYGISIPINASTPISSFKRSIGKLFIEKRIFTLQNQNIKNIQCNSDILP